MSWDGARPSILAVLTMVYAAPLRSGDTGPRLGVVDDGASRTAAPLIG